MRTKKIMAINVRKYSYSCELVTQNEIDYMRTCRLWLKPRPHWRLHSRRKYSRRKRQL